MKRDNELFRAAIAKRGLTIDALADMIVGGRCAVTQVLRGQRNGTPTWAKLARVLSHEEMMLALAFANSKLALKGLRVQPKQQPDGAAVAPVRFEVVQIETGKPPEVPRRTKGKSLFASKTP